MKAKLDTYAIAYVEGLAARVTELEARCKRLEEAGDEMRYAGVFTPKWDGTDTTHVVDAWEKAKEAKP